MESVLFQSTSTPAFPLTFVAGCLVTPPAIVITALVETFNITHTKAFVTFVIAFVVAFPSTCIKSFDMTCVKEFHIVFAKACI